MSDTQLSCLSVKLLHLVYSYVWWSLQRYTINNWGAKTNTEEKLKTNSSGRHLKMEGPFHLRLLLSSNQIRVIAVVDFWWQHRIVKQHNKVERYIRRRKGGKGFDGGKNSIVLCQFLVYFCCYYPCQGELEREREREIKVRRKEIIDQSRQDVYLPRRTKQNSAILLNNSDNSIDIT